MPFFKDSQNRPTSSDSMIIGLLFLHVLLQSLSRLKFWPPDKRDISFVAPGIYACLLPYIHVLIIGTKRPGLLRDVRNVRRTTIKMHITVKCLIKGRIFSARSDCEAQVARHSAISGSMRGPISANAYILLMDSTSHDHREWSSLASCAASRPCLLGLSLDILSRAFG